MASDSKGGASTVDSLQIDEVYEFCAPRFFDFLNEETEEEIQRAELWFETSLSYAPSPFMPKIKEGRTVKIDSLCDFGKEPEPEVEVTNTQKDNPTSVAEIRHGQETEIKESLQQEVKDGNISFEFDSKVNHCDGSHPQQEEDKSLSVNVSTISAAPTDTLSKESSSFAFPILSKASATETCTPKAPAVPVNRTVMSNLKKQRASEAYTPKAQRVLTKGGAAITSSKKETAKIISSSRRQLSALKPKDQSPYVQSSRSMKPKSVIKCRGTITSKNNAMADIAQENQAIKRQKLDEERSRQIHNIKTRVLLHKSKPGSAGGTEDLCRQREATPFMSTAELVKKFQSRTRDMELSQNKSISHEGIASVIQRRPKLTLTRPKEPEFETAQRVRAVRVKSSAELEEEMLAKIPKFKARPLNKKILEAPSLPAPPRSIPKAPEFQEFHLKTMERANQLAETSSVASSIETSSQNHGKPLKLTEPRPPVLETSLRARPPKVKSSQELELEEMEKIPKFKARPLNKKILESKGDLGLFCHQKPQVTVPQEFHFVTDERLGPPSAVVELFDKLSLQSDSSSHHEVPRITIPNPFHLHTEERGLEKERQFSVQILQKQFEEEQARIPRANPYPYTTDYPVIPPKPEPKPCTKPEAFQLESLVRHEEELQRILEEKERMEKEEAQRRLFRAQPVLKEDPIPLPERERKPLTDVQEFVFHAGQRAVERSEFDKKIKEKESTYKRLREENEHAKMIEEEKAVKQMRRTMVPHARPLPKFCNPFLPQKSTKETTKPKSPVLLVKQREERRRHVHMR